MLVQQIALKNSLQNYMYLVACPETKEAIAIDPLYHQLCLQTAQKLGWKIKGVLNTHEHHDHIGGNQAVIEATKATLFAHHKAVGVIPNVDVGLKAGDTVKVGNTIELHALDTPGHTFCHSCFYFAGNLMHAPALFSGDTLFYAGVGDCHNGGDVNVMYHTFSEQIFTLSDDTMIYPGHDYIQNNLRFSLDREPSNRFAKGLLLALEQWQSEMHFISTIGIEREINSFFRLNNEEIIEKLKSQFKDWNTLTSEEDVFIKLRECRNQW